MNKNVKNEKLGLLNVAIAGIIWGTQGLLIKVLSNRGIDSGFIAFDRAFMATIFAFFVSIILYGFKAFKITKINLFWCMVAGIITQGIYNISYSLAVEYVGVSFAVVLLYLAPVFTAIFSAVFCKEKISVKTILILILNIIGCIIAITGLNFSLENLSLFGILMGIISAIAYGSSPILSKFSNKNPNIFIVIFYINLFASIFTLLFTRPKINNVIFKFDNLFLLVFFGIFTCGFAYMFFYNGIKMLVTLSKSLVIASIEIIVATILGYVICNENLHFINFIGVGIIFLSIYLASFK